jgi:MFS family permease
VASISRITDRYDGRLPASSRSANPAIQSHLHASLADIQWVTNAYLLALAVSLITIGKVGDRFRHGAPTAH